MIKRTQTPFLIIEAKKLDVSEKTKREDLFKMAKNLKEACNYRHFDCPLFGVHISGLSCLFFFSGDLVFKLVCSVLRACFFSLNKKVLSFLQ